MITPPSTTDTDHQISFLRRKIRESKRKQHFFDAEKLEVELELLIKRKKNEQSLNH